ncbi:D-alanyl-D-alanine carboxypeptidase [Labrenzia suaedae]|uniref:serine-type D-Ala-D-Ala carboxypeptidase n=2 Tax=Roseibium litorale TaxID=2803841 RepID=A0ABR9CKA4_9HYPH|nr:D-alanyl-D-alanine carboxypeptidase family protein [Roseibium litorale]MBD8890845.1 D-alanyl-D-alanine carboxypeptidase [Roseibium litorale]
MAAALLPAAAETLGTRAPVAFLYAPGTSTSLYLKDADKAFEPGSLVKVMTAAAVFEALSGGEVTPETTCKVSEHAWRTGGAPSRRATMFAAIKSEIPVMDLLRGLLIHNANDAAIVLAECLDGSEEAFAGRMNTLAASLGMNGSHFVNPTGYGTLENPDSKGEASRTTARDMAKLGQFILEKHWDYYPLFSEPEFTWNNIYQRNKNPLLGEIRELDGMGAGQAASGFSGLASVERNGRRVIAVVAGLSDEKTRLAAMKEVVEGAWDYFAVERIFAKGETVTEAKVFGGTASTVPLRTVSDVDVLLPRGGTLDYRLRVVYSGPLKAPVRMGTPSGEIQVLGNDGIVYRAPLETAGEVDEGSLEERALGAVSYYLFGWF